MIVNYHKENYIGQNMVIVGTGDFTHREFVGMVEEQFGKIHKGPDNYHVII